MQQQRLFWGVLVAFTMVLFYPWLLTLDDWIRRRLTALLKGNLQDLFSFALCRWGCYPFPLPSHLLFTAMNHIDDTLLVDWCLQAAVWCLKSVDDMKWSRPDPCMAVKKEETVLFHVNAAHFLFRALPSEAGTGNEDWASDCLLWFPATFLFESLLPSHSLCFLPHSPLCFSCFILSLPLVLPASR